MRIYSIIGMPYTDPYTGVRRVKFFFQQCPSLKDTLQYILINITTDFFKYGGVPVEKYTERDEDFQAVGIDFKKIKDFMEEVEVRHNDRRLVLLLPTRKCFDSPNIQRKFLRILKEEGTPWWDAIEIEL